MHQTSVFGNTGSGAAPVREGGPAAGEAAGERILWQAGDRYVAISAKIPVRIDNPSATRASAIAYTTLKTKQFKRLYLIADSRQLSTRVKFVGNDDEMNGVLEVEGTAPIGAVVIIDYSTGSRKHVYFQFTKAFRVTAAGLVEIPYPNSEERATAEAEILNNGWAPSQYQPVRTLYSILRAEVEEG